jgi:hypothetical protein
LALRPIYFPLRRISSLFDRFISLFGHLGNLPHSFQQHQRLGRVDAVLEGRKIGVFLVFSQRTGKQSHVAAGPVLRGARAAALQIRRIVQHPAAQ